MSLVSLLKCKNYEEEKLKQVLLESINNLGGLESYFKKGDKILLKVNLVMGLPSERAATTNHIFVKVLAEILEENGMFVLIADSPGGTFNTKRLLKAYKKSGLSLINESDNIKLNKNDNVFNTIYKDGKQLKEFPLCDFVNDVDHIISVAKLKTHTFLGFTGAVKNLFGCIPGLTKAKYHLKYSSIPDFAEMIVELCEYLNPTLSFIDGITAMEGNGPVGGKPIHIGAVMASSNPYELDDVACDLIKIEKSKIKTITNSKYKKLISDNIIIKGNSINDFKIKSFKEAKTNTGGMLLRSSLFKRYPVINKKCIGCKVCQEICPVNTINIIDKKAKITYKKCIRCFCCHEFCEYDAINVKKKLFRPK